MRGAGKNETINQEPEGSFLDREDPGERMIKCYT